MNAIVKRGGQTVAFDRRRVTIAIAKAAASVGGFGIDEAEALSFQVEDQVDHGFAASVPTVEDVQDIVESVLMASGHLKTARAYIIYRNRRSEARSARAEAVEVTDTIPYKLIYEVLRWNIEHGCESIQGLNQLIEEGAFPELIRASEARYEQECLATAEQILARGDDLRMVIVAGPSSSGKTTTTIKLEQALARAGLKLKALNVDHYFFDLDAHPQDEFGDYDYESPQALDLPLINQHLEALMGGKTVMIPHYDFHTGTRTLNVHATQLAPHEVLLVDSLHGLYPPMTACVAPEQKFCVYLETLGQLRNEHDEFMRWTDHRLLRRMIRDRWNRGHDPMLTLTHWHYVRKSELQHIIPYISEVDAIVNSAMPYEMPLLKHKLIHWFSQAIEQFHDEPKRQDAFLRAQRVLQFLEPLARVKDGTPVPARSLFREFIGGSEYTY